MERSFSLIKGCSVEKLQEESLVSQMTVHDAILSAGGVQKVKITKEMIHAICSANPLWKEALQINKTTDTRS